MSIVRAPRPLAGDIIPGAVALLLSLCLAPPSAAQARLPAKGQCAAAGTPRSGALPGAAFDVSLPPFGQVCFLGRERPLPDDPDHSSVIAFELWRDGALAYRLPEPDGGLWPPACDGILAVGFPRSGKFRDVVVIGQCEGADAEQAQPLVYRAGPGGYVLDARLSTDLMGVKTVAEVTRRMHRDAARAGR